MCYYRGSREKKAFLREQSPGVNAAADGSQEMIANHCPWHRENFDGSSCRGVLGMEAGLQWVEERTGHDTMETSADNLATRMVSITLVTRDVVMRQDHNQRC